MGHKKRFDDLLAKAVRKDGVLTAPNVTSGATRTTITSTGPVTTSTTTLEQMEAYTRAVADGSYGGL